MGLLALSPRVGAVMDCCCCCCPFVLARDSFTGVDGTSLEFHAAERGVWENDGTSPHPVWPEILSDSIVAGAIDSGFAWMDIGVEDKYAQAVFHGATLGGGDGAYLFARVAADESSYVALRINETGTDRWYLDATDGSADHLAVATDGQVGRIDVAGMLTSLTVDGVQIPGHLVTAVTGTRVGVLLDDPSNVAERFDSFEAGAPCVSDESCAADNFVRADDPDLNGDALPVGAVSWSTLLGTVAIATNAAEVTAVGVTGTGGVGVTGPVDSITAGTQSSIGGILSARTLPGGAGLAILEGTPFALAGRWVLYDAAAVVVLDSLVGWAAGYMVAMRCVGDQVTWYVRGVDQGTFTMDPSLAAATLYGVGGLIGGRMNNFSVCSI